MTDGADNGLADPGKRAALEHRVRAHWLPGDDHMVEHWNTDDLRGAHEARRRLDILGAGAWVAGRMIVTDDHCGGAGGEPGSQDDAGVDRADAVLRADRGDVGAGDRVRAVDEQAGEVFAVGKADQRVQRADGGTGVIEAGFGEAQGAAGLDETDVVDGDFVEGGTHRGAFRGFVRAVRERAARRGAPGRTAEAFSEGHARAHANAGDRKNEHGPRRAEVPGRASSSRWVASHAMFGCPGRAPG